MIQNTLAMFLAQDYQDKYLLILDDQGNYPEQKGDNWALLSTSTRFPSLGEKYMHMLKVMPTAWNYFALWDDDDLYLPWHLSQGVEAASKNKDGWSKCGKIWTTYDKPDGTYWLEENTKGRFHGTLVVSRGAMGHVGYWSTASSFDLQFISDLTKHQEPELTCPSYLYRWQDTHARHSSSVEYSKHQPQYRKPVSVIAPVFDDLTYELYTKLIQEPRCPN